MPLTQPLAADVYTEGSVGARALGNDHKLPQRGKVQDATTGADVSVTQLLNALDFYKLDVNDPKWHPAELLGTGLTITGAGAPALAALNGTDVAFFDDLLESLRVYRFNGSTWSLVGSGLTITGAFAPALAALNGTDVAFIDSTNESLRAYRHRLCLGAPYHP